jgi:hypothetical protein
MTKVNSTMKNLTPALPFFLVVQVYKERPFSLSSGNIFNAGQLRASHHRRDRRSSVRREQGYKA